MGKGAAHADFQLRTLDLLATDGDFGPAAGNLKLLLGFFAFYFSLVGNPATTFFDLGDLARGDDGRHFGNLDLFEGQGCFAQTCDDVRWGGIHLGQ